MSNGGFILKTCEFYPTTKGTHNKKPTTTIFAEVGFLEKRRIKG